MAEYPWWQWVDGAGLTAITRPRGATRHKPRYAAIAPFVVGRSPYLSYQRIFGGSQFCAPVPKNAPDANPTDPYIAGRYLRDTSIFNATGFAATFNIRQYNLATFVVDSSLPPGPLSAGGGNYQRGQLWQAYRQNFYIKRGGGLYQPMTMDEAIPVGYHAAPGTDESASILDAGTGRIVETWHTRSSTGDLGVFPWVGPRPDGSLTYTVDGSGNRTYHDAIPAGEWSYWTCGICEDTETTTGAFVPGRGNVVASGLIGMALQVGIDEMLAACGLRRDTDGSISTVPPVVDAIQHVIGIELASGVAEGPAYSWPATFSDGYVTPAHEILYGQRLYFDLSRIDLNTITDPLARALTWTGGVYGFMVTDKGGNFAIRGEPWRDPGTGAPDPWDVMFSAGRTRLGTLQAMPWQYLRSLPKDYGKPGTPSDGLMQPIGLPPRLPAIDPRSLWVDTPVTHGSKLDPAEGRKAGTPAGWTPAATMGALQANTAGATYTDVRFTGRVTVIAPDVTFVRCRFAAAGYTETGTPSPGSEYYGVIAGVEATSGPTFVDCDFHGGRGNAAYSHGRFTRCYFRGGVDLLRVSERGPTTVVECVFDGQIPDSPTAHVDAIQATTTATGKSLQMTILRSWIVSRDLAGTTGDTAGNAAIQFGSYGAGTFATGEVTDCYLDGGQYTLQVGGQTSASSTVVFRGNLIGRSGVYGSRSSSSVAGIDFDSSNRWADTLTPA